MSWLELDQRLALWHRRKFGTGEINLPKTVAKLAEEFGELVKDLNKGRYETAREELADVVFVLTHLARFLGTSLEAECDHKLRVIEKRLEERK